MSNDNIEVTDIAISATGQCKRCKIYSTVVLFNGDTRQESGYCWKCYRKELSEKGYEITGVGCIGNNIIGKTPTAIIRKASLNYVP